MEKFNKEEPYSVVSVDQHPYLFTNLRVDRDSVPEGLFVYDVGDADCDGTFARIQKHVLVNHWGTIIGRHELPLEDGVYYPEFGSEEYEGCYFDEMTLEELDEADPEQFATKKAVDGEYAVRQGGKYVFTGTFLGKVKPSAFKKAMRNSWPFGEVGVSNIDFEFGKDTTVHMTIIPVRDMRNQTFADLMLGIADELETGFDYVEPYVVPVSA